jgi:hypothetical protein
VNAERTAVGRSAFSDDRKVASNRLTGSRIVVGDDVLRDES